MVILLEGMTAVTAAPEWNAAPPTSYLARMCIELWELLSSIIDILVDVRAMITQNRVWRLSKVRSQSNLVRTSTRRHE
jgi:hypothetical protein